MTSVVKAKAVSEIPSSADEIQFPPAHVAIRLSSASLLEYGIQKIHPLLDKEHFQYEVMTVFNFLPTLHTIIHFYQDESFIEKCEKKMGQQYADSYLQRISSIHELINEVIPLWKRYPFLTPWESVIIETEFTEDELIQELYNDSFFTEPSIEQTLTLLIWICEISQRFESICSNVEQHYEWIETLLFDHHMDKSIELIQQIIKPISLKK